MRPTQPPSLDPRLADATRALFRFLSRERRHRIFHPIGRAYRCEIVVLAETPVAPAGRYSGFVRFSRGIGLPRPLPDVLGLALRIENAHEAGHHQDVLLASTFPRRRACYLPIPVTTFFGTTFSSLLPYRLGGNLALLLARAPARPSLVLEPLEELDRAAAAGPVAFDLAVAPAGAPWPRVATVTVVERLAEEEASRLRFNPYNTGTEAIPVWLPNRLRDPAYRGSQEGRPVPD